MFNQQDLEENKSLVINAKVPSFTAIPNFFVGCSDYGSAPFFTEQQVGNILLKTHLQELIQAQSTATLTLSDIAPSSVTSYEVSGYNYENAILFGSQNYPKQAEILIENVPIAVNRLKIQLLNIDGLVIGTATITVKQIAIKLLLYKALQPQRQSPRNLFYPLR